MDFRQRLEQSRTQIAGGAPSAEQDEHFASRFFATDRGNSPACIDMWLSDGSRKAIPYSYVSSINFEPDVGIEILTAQMQITITGRNLTALYEALISYRVRYVKADMGGDFQEDGLFVKVITIEEIL